MSGASGSYILQGAEHTTPFYVNNNPITRYAYKNYQGAALYYAGDPVTYTAQGSKWNGGDLYEAGSAFSVRVVSGTGTAYTRGGEYTSPLYVPDSNGTSRKVSLLKTSLYYDGDGSVTTLNGSYTYSGTLLGTNQGKDFYKAGKQTTYTPIGTNATALTAFYVRDPDNDERVYRHNRDNLFEGSLYAPGTQHVELEPAKAETDTVTALTAP